MLPVELGRSLVGRVSFRRMFIISCQEKNVLCICKCTWAVISSPALIYLLKIVKNTIALLKSLITHSCFWPTPHVSVKQFVPHLASTASCSLSPFQLIFHNQVAFPLQFATPDWTSVKSKLLQHELLFLYTLKCVLWVGVLAWCRATVHSSLLSCTWP